MCVCVCVCKKKRRKGSQYLSLNTIAVLRDDERSVIPARRVPNSRNWNYSHRNYIPYRKSNLNVSKVLSHCHIALFPEILLFVSRLSFSFTNEYLLLFDHTEWIFPSLITKHLLLNSISHRSVYLMRDIYPEVKFVRIIMIKSWLSVSYSPKGQT